MVPIGYAVPAPNAGGFGADVSAGLPAAAPRKLEVGFAALSAGLGLAGLKNELSVGFADASAGLPKASPPDGYTLLAPRANPDTGASLGAVLKEVADAPPNKLLVGAEVDVGLDPKPVPMAEVDAGAFAAAANELVGAVIDPEAAGLALNKPPVGGAPVAPFAALVEPPPPPNRLLPAGLFPLPKLDVPVAEADAALPNKFAPAGLVVALPEALAPKSPAPDPEEAGAGLEAFAPKRPVPDPEAAGAGVVAPAPNRPPGLAEALPPAAGVPNRVPVVAGLFAATLPNRLLVEVLPAEFPNKLVLIIDKCIYLISNYIFHQL